MKIQGEVTGPATVQCPTCGAKPGWTCRTNGFGGDRTAHATRRRAFEAAVSRQDAVAEVEAEVASLLSREEKAAAKRKARLARIVEVTKALHVAIPARIQPAPAAQLLTELVGELASIVGEME